MAPLHASIQAYLKEQNSTARLLSPEHPEFEAAQAGTGKKPDVPPALIALPKTAGGVQALVRYCAQNNVGFAVRTGGRDSPVRGGTQTGVIWIDLRDIDFVGVAAGKATARVGGGIFFKGLSESLKKKGVIMPE
ncbi:hypothetical protein F4802DRAFT_477716 [Xylaria palmicola]|nr:hypothetical protein F4802DRAFT_477716 [Xylaria palmicola]